MKQLKNYDSHRLARLNKLGVIGVGPINHPDKQYTQVGLKIRKGKLGKKYFEKSMPWHENPSSVTCSSCGRLVADHPENMEGYYIGYKLINEQCCFKYV